jgi:hypothetical protein
MGVDEGLLLGRLPTVEVNGGDAKLMATPFDESMQKTTLIVCLESGDIGGCGRFGDADGVVGKKV